MGDCLQQQLTPLIGILSVCIVGESFTAVARTI